MLNKTIALFGGSFDPIHVGHTAVTEAAASHIAAEKVIFIPARRSPLKCLRPTAGDEDRVAMIRLAIADSGIFELSDYELTKPAPSYTLDTVRKFQCDYGPGALIHWLVGADTIDELPLWHGAAELIDICNISTMYRAGCKTPDFSGFTRLWGRERIEKLQQNVIETPLVEISSTQIRKRLAAGLSVAGMVHPAVADYIKERHLYGSN